MFSARGVADGGAPAAGFPIGGTALGAVLVLLALLTPSPALAKEQAFDFCPAGSLGGQCGRGGGVAINQDGNGGVAAGTVYISDQNRIQSFTGAGAFIRAWGWDVIKPGEPNDTGTEFEICEVAAECKAGVAGGAAGQFNAGFSNGLAVDQASGDVYVIDQGNNRVEQFDATGHFIRTWGADVVTGGGTGYEICEVAAECKAGIAGAAGGEFEFSGLAGIAVDAAGNVYLAEASNGRVQKFSSAGAFLAAAGADVDAVNLTTGYEVCTVAANCKAGLEAAPFSRPQSVAVSPAGDVYVADNPNSRVYRLSASLALDASFYPDALKTGSTVPRMIAVDPASSHLFLTKDSESTIYEIDPASQETIEETDGEVTRWFGGIAVNGASGRLYASPTTTFSGGNYIRAFDPGTLPSAVTSPNVADVGGTSATLRGWANPHGSALSECRFDYGTSEAYDHSAPCAQSAGEIGAGQEPVEVSAPIDELELGTVYHFRLHVKSATGEDDGLDQQFQTVGPAILATWSEGVAFSEATLKAEVDPEGKATTYHFDWGTAEGVYPNHTAELPAGEDSSPHEVSAPLSGLTPGVTYHYRAVAESSDGTRIGPDRAFTTYRLLTLDTECPNQALRIGPAAALPDCRGYEMVSPVDKGGGDIVALGNTGYGTHPAGQASVDGKRVTYVSKTSFGDAQRGAWDNQYLSTRGAERWSTHGLNPPQGTTVFDPEESLNFDLGEAFLAFTPDLCGAILRDHNLEPLAPDAVQGFPNLYQRGNCGQGADSYRTLTEGAPPFSLDELTGSKAELMLNSATYSADGEHAVFAAGMPLDSTPAAGEGDNQQVYEYNLGTGRLSLVSVLPGGEATSEDAALGLGSMAGYGSPRQKFDSPLAAAVSGDGSRVFWTNGDGKLYVRVDGTTTLPVSPFEPAKFLGAAADGAAAVYSQGDELKLFDVDKALAGESGATVKLAGQAGGLVGASGDFSRIYFTSKEDLDEDGEAEAGALNLYLREGGTVRLVTALADEDGAAAPSGARIDAPEPLYHSSHVSPDGRYLAFMSLRPLTGYENVDAASGKEESEIFRYDAASGRINCVSCKPSGARPEGRPLDPPYNLNGEELKAWAAAWLPSWENGTYEKRVLAPDGSRILFNSYDALVPTDTNGAQDVYQWEAPGTGSCEEARADYFPSLEGCLALLSTGQSSDDSELVDASVSGDDVFFTTAASIDPRDPGSIDLYDARVGGGTEPPPPPQPECLGDACQPVPTPPAVRAPSSSSFVGPGDVPPPRDCRSTARRAKRLATRARRLRRAARKARAPRRSRALRRRSVGSAAKAKRLSRNAKRCRRANRRAGR